MENKVYNLFQKIINTIFLIVLLFVSYFVVFTNVYTMEYVTQVKIIYGILPIPFLLFVCFILLKKQLISWIVSNKKYFNFCFYFFLFIVGLVLINYSNPPRTDAAICLDFSNNLNIFNSGEVSQFRYLVQYIHNLGITLFDSLFSSFYQVIVLRLLNVLMVIGVYWLLENTFLTNEKEKAYFKIIGIFWLPLIFLVPLVYGWIYGLFFLCLGIYFFKLFSKTYKAIYILSSIISLIISIILKQNYLIVVFAMIIVICVNRVNRKFKIVIALLIAMLFGMKLPSFIAYNVFNFPSNSSQPVSLHFVMANYRGNYESLPGWVDGYHESIYSSIVETNGYENAQTLSNSQARNMLKSNLIEGLNNKLSFYHFYRDKLLTGWGSKDFGVFNELQYSLKNLNLEENHLVSLILLFIHFSLYLIVMGSVIWIIVDIKTKKTLFDQFISLSFVGFFLFYLISEMQSRYLVCSITFLLPLAAKGLADFNVDLYKNSNKVFVFSFMFLPVIFNTRNIRFQPVVNSIDSEEKVSTSIAVPHYYQFSINDNTVVDGVNVMLDGNGVGDVFSLTLYDNTRDKILFSTEYSNLVVEAYWFNTLEFNKCNLFPGDYTLIFQSKCDHIKLLVDYNNLPFCEILNKDKYFTEIQNLRYIKTNNFGH